MPWSHLQNDGPPGAPDEPGTDGWRLHPDVEPLLGEPVLRKHTDDGFVGTPLAALLAARGVTRVVLGGLLSEMCVSVTARSALGRGLAVLLPADAHGTYDLDEIPAAVVPRVAAHSLGDQLEQPASLDAVSFTRPVGG